MVRLARALWSMILAWWRPPRPTPVETPDTPQVRTAVHEAGHALAAWRCSKVVEIRCVTIDGPTGGFVDYAAPPPRTADELWCQLVIILAGIAAELAVYRTTRSGPAERDLRFARRRARMLAALGGPAPPWTLRTKEPPAQRFERLYERPLSAGEATALRVGYDKARLLIRDSHAQHGRLVALLLHQHTLDHAAMRVLLGSRAWVRLIGLTRPRFLERL